MSVNVPSPLSGNIWKSGNIIFFFLAILCSNKHLKFLFPAGVKENSLGSLGEDEMT